MVLSFSVVDGLDLQLIAVTLELLILFGGAFHRQEAVYHREKGDWVVVELFIIGHLFIGQTDKAVITIPTNNERPGNAAIIPIKTVWRQAKVLCAVIADNASAISPRVIYALSDFLIMILSWLVKQSLRAFLFQEVQP